MESIDDGVRGIMCRKGGCGGLGVVSVAAAEGMESEQELLYTFKGGVTRRKASTITQWAKERVEACGGRRNSDSRSTGWS